MGVAGTLIDPAIAIIDGANNQVASNDNWGTGNSTALSAAFTQAGASDGKTSKFQSTDLTGAQSVHYIASNLVSAIPVTGTATYSFFAGTPSTSADGVIGQGATSGSLSVNFASLSGSANLTVIHGATYNLSSALALNSSNTAKFAGSGSGGAPWNFEGFFGGGNRITGAPARAGISYVISPISGLPIAGVAAFK